MSKKILYTEEQIAKRISQLAKEITRDYHQKPLVLIGLLKGAFIVIADLLRALYQEGYTDIEVSFVTLKSYHASMSVSQEVSLITESDIAVKGRHVLLIDDIFDTGKSFVFAQEYMKKQGALSVAGFVLLSKPERHEVSYRPQYVGFEVPDKWIEGYGMDSAEKGRGNPQIVYET